MDAFGGGKIHLEKQKNEGNEKKKKSQPTCKKCMQIRFFFEYFMSSRLLSEYRASEMEKVTLLRYLFFHSCQRKKRKLRDEKNIVSSCNNNNKNIFLWVRYAQLPLYGNKGESYLHF